MITIPEVEERASEDRKWKVLFSLVKKLYAMLSSEVPKQNVLKTNFTFVFPCIVVYVK